ncbi:hypothetical protein SCOCK_690013 [Actinacidiphila cocklensis]|uniref:Uncharacterized protein n=1 Tax=Actinacidiphila cocklensis TaxID=887465 RepID=A0A9W4EB63_9ACTN|nr:hypothetical protein SCOCK_690013 [Actinacidiphila cocklensis]
MPPRPPSAPHSEWEPAAVLASTWAWLPLMSPLSSTPTTGHSAAGTCLCRPRPGRAHRGCGDRHALRRPNPPRRPGRRQRPLGHNVYTAARHPGLSARRGHLEAREDTVPDLPDKRGHVEAVEDTVPQLSVHDRAVATSARLQALCGPHGLQPGTSSRGVRRQAVARGPGAGPGPVGRR